MLPLFTRVKRFCTLLIPACRESLQTTFASGIKQCVSVLRGFADKVSELARALARQKRGFYRKRSSDLL